MRSNTLDAARRGYLGLVRGTIDSVDDSQMMQTVTARLLHNEVLSGIERPQNYGFSSVPMPPQGTQAAELMVGFMHGNRSHPMVLGVDDRRYRPKNNNPGDVKLWHHAGNTAGFTDTGWQQTHADKQPWTITIGTSTFTIADGKITATVGGTSIVLTDGKIAFGAEGASIPVMLQTGPSSLLFSTK